MEVLKKYPILLLGAGSGLGQVLAQRFATEGYQVIAGTRSEEKFDALRQSIVEAGGVEPRPFIADITQSDQLMVAYQSLTLAQHEKVHYFPVAAGGLEGLNRGIVRAMLPLMKAAKAGDEITTDQAKAATDSIKALTTTQEAIAPAMDVNLKSPLTIFDILAEDDHLGSDSTILNTSSSVSDGFDTEHPENYPGPWFYYTIARSKKEGVLALRQKATEVGAIHLDVVAPEIADTGVGKFIDGLVEIISKVEGVGEIDIPKVYRAPLVEAIYRELKVESPKIRTLYVEPATQSYQRPPVWDKPLVPYL